MTEKLKFLKLKSIYLLYFMFLPAFMINISSCTSHKGHTMKKKKLKRGRPIPCPVKDC
ncbi:hypothetical protein [Bernardetia sp.]|uniref:hypothetical protein n=1 Tax=Bernardetia sp. TaxID=1937974 RepID=UPI0025BFD069|nr:hypothetical protein [Bernardetia sp.]